MTSSGTYGSFLLSNQEFAIAVSYIREVVNVDLNSCKPLPLSPPNVRGLFNLRGALIPVLDLSSILNLSSDGKQKNQKLVVLERKRQFLGLLVDQTQELLRVSDEDQHRIESSAQATLKSVFKLQGGERLVQELDIERIYELPDIPFQEASNQENSQAVQASQKGERKKCVSLQIMEHQCAVPIECIQEITKIDKIESHVLSTGFCLGMIQLRGSVIPVLDLGAILGYRETLQQKDFSSGKERLLVIKQDNELLGYLVDGVESLLSYFIHEVKNLPIRQSQRHKAFIGCLETQDKNLVLLLNPLCLLSEEERKTITHGHSTLFHSSQAKQDEQKKKSANRKAFITFSVDTTFAVSIDEIREIIKEPHDLMVTPGAPPFLSGVLNLRNELIPIVDTRVMYNRPATENKDRKVLIFRFEGQAFGLIVDSVDEIVTFSESDKLKLPQVLFHNDRNEMAQDVQEAAQITNLEGVKKNLLILSAQSLFKRIQGSISSSAA